MPDHDMISLKDLECCPTLARAPACDTLDFRYRLPWRARDARVDVILHFRLERCSGPLALGDLAYSTTLFPGERVRLFTSDRHNRWTYDAATQLSYRHETTSEESYYAWGMARSMTDLTQNESGSSSTSYEEDWASGGGGLSVDLFGIVEIGGGGQGGSYDADSTSSFARNLSRHAESSSSYVAAAVRASSSTAVGEVETRAHAEGESESHLESSTRTFHNPNRCHAVTYFFYKLLKQQKVRFRLVAVQRVVSDPAAPTVPDHKPTPDVTGKVRVRPQAILAASKDRLEVERVARQAAVEREQAMRGVATGGVGLSALRFSAATAVREPLPLNARQAALKAVDDDLKKAGIIDAQGNPTDKIIAELSWEREEWLPTAGVVVKGCLDDCSTCEPTLKREIDLELEHQKLRNKLLERQIELLDKTQEYRCCPEGEGEDEEDEG